VQVARIHLSQEIFRADLEETALSNPVTDGKTRLFRIRRLVRALNREELLGKGALPLVYVTTVGCQHRLDQVAVVAYDSHSAVSDGVGRSRMV
jgi:hypothetical protein